MREIIVYMLAGWGLNDLIFQLIRLFKKTNRLSSSTIEEIERIHGKIRRSTGDALSVVPTEKESWREEWKKESAHWDIASSVRPLVESFLAEKIGEAELRGYEKGKIETLMDVINQFNDLKTSEAQDIGER